MSLLDSQMNPYSPENLYGQPDSAMGFGSIPDAMSLVPGQSREPLTLQTGAPPSLPSAGIPKQASLLGDLMQPPEMDISGELSQLESQKGPLQGKLAGIEEQLRAGIKPEEMSLGQALAMGMATLLPAFLTKGAGAEGALKGFMQENKRMSEVAQENAQSKYLLGREQLKDAQDRIYQIEDQMTKLKEKATDRKADYVSQARAAVLHDQLTTEREKLIAGINHANAISRIGAEENAKLDSIKKEADIYGMTPKEVFERKNPIRDSKSEKDNDPLDPAIGESIQQQAAARGLNISAPTTYGEFKQAKELINLEIAGSNAKSAAARSGAQVDRQKLTEEKWDTLLNADIADGVVTRKTGSMPDQSSLRKTAETYGASMKAVYALGKIRDMVSEKGRLQIAGEDATVLAGYVKPLLGALFAADKLPMLKESLKLNEMSLPQVGAPDSAYKAWLMATTSNEGTVDAFNIKIKSMGQNLKSIISGAYDLNLTDDQLNDPYFLSDELARGRYKPNKSQGSLLDKVRGVKK